MKFKIEIYDISLIEKTNRNNKPYKAIQIEYNKIEKGNIKSELKTKISPLFTTEGKFLMDHWVIDKEDLPKGTTSDRLDPGNIYLVEYEKDEVSGFYKWIGMEIQ